MAEVDRGRTVSEVPDESDHRRAYFKLLASLLSRAASIDTFETICTMLRVGGMADANWDPFEESRGAFNDYNWALEALAKERGETAVRRQRLLMYCQAVEMSAPHELMANLLRVISRQPYFIDPFHDLWRPEKKGRPAVPPSAKTKLRRIQELARQTGEEALADAIGRFFDDRIRNAFSHSDYVITPDHFRFSEGRIAKQIPVADLDSLVDECFAFYGAFLAIHRRWLLDMAGVKRFHKMPRYEVLELLSTPDLGLYGFNLHFSNGTKATYTRRPERREAINLFFTNDGRIGFMQGDLGALEPVWKVDGNAVVDWREMP